MNPGWRWLWRVLAFVASFAALGICVAEEQPMLRIENGGHTASIRHLATNVGGTILLSASEDKTARLWRAADGKLLTVLRPPIGAGNEGKLFAAALTPNGNVAAVSGWSADNDIYLFRVSDGVMLSRISGLPNVANHLTFSPDGKALAAVLWGGHGLRTYSSKNNWTTASLAGADEDYVGDSYGADFSPDGATLLTSAHDGQLRLYALRGGAPWLLRKAAIGTGKQPHSVKFSPDGKLIAVGFADVARVVVVRADTLEPTFSPDIRGIDKGGLSSVAWSADGLSLYAAGTWRVAMGQNSIRRWSDGGRGSYRDMAAASDSITDLVALPSGRIAFASADAGWGVIGNDAVALRVATQRADFRAGWDEFRVAANGRAVSFGFAFGGKSPATFDVENLVWRPAGLALPEPAISARGIEISDWKDGLSPKINGAPVVLEAGEMSTSVAIDPSKAALVFGTTWYVRMHDLRGRELWKTPVPAPCFAVQVTLNGQWVVAAFGDGTIRWFRRDNGEEALALFPHGDRKAWVLWTPDGRFAASNGGDQTIGWHLNHGPNAAAEFLPVGRFSERYFDPLGVVSTLAQEPPAKRPVADIREGIKLPPTIKILSPANDQEFSGGSARIEVSVKDRGGGVDEIRLSLNGKVVGTALPKPAKRSSAAKPGETKAVFDITLEDGKNILKVVALNRDRAESASDDLVITSTDTSDRPQLHVLAIGVNTYRNAALNLVYSVPDARGVAEFFRDSGRQLFRNIKVTELFDADATKAKILASLNDLRDAKNADVVVVYLAGHGTTLKDDWYFVPHDVTNPEVAEALAKGGLSSTELAGMVKSIPARKVVVLIDACKSGAATIGFRGLEERRVLAQLSRATGTHLIASTTKEQLASEIENLGHGVFTYALLEGLGGKASASSQDVTARKLMVYVEQALPELSKRYRTEEQFPVVSSTGMDFPLTVHEARGR
jgi:WD40 repeat protein